MGHPVNIHSELRRALNEFIVVQTQRFVDTKAEEALDRTLASEAVPCSMGEREPVGEAPLAFEECFRHVIRTCGGPTLQRLIEQEATMAEEMAALVRARDFELERLTRQCELLLSAFSVESGGGDGSDQHCYNLSMLNEKLRVVAGSYQSQLEVGAARLIPLNT